MHIRSYCDLKTIRHNTEVESMQISIREYYRCRANYSAYLITITSGSESSYKIPS